MNAYGDKPFIYSLYPAYLMTLMASFIRASTIYSTNGFHLGPVHGVEVLVSYEIKRSCFLEKCRHRDRTDDYYDSHGAYSGSAIE